MNNTTSAATQSNMTDAAITDSKSKLEESTPSTINQINFPQYLDPNSTANGSSGF